MTPAEATARRLYASGKQPTDAHPYEVHVAYDVLYSSGELFTDVTEFLTDPDED